jgi:hypothetical protein
MASLAELVRQAGKLRQENDQTGVCGLNGLQ